MHVPFVFFDTHEAVRVRAEDSRAAETGFVLMSLGMRRQDLAHDTMII